MADITNRQLEQLLSTTDAERRDAETQISDNIIDELNTPPVRANILRILRTTNDARGLSSINFSDQLPSIHNAINNLTVDTTDQAEIDRLNNARRELRQRVNIITRRALIERISDFESDLNPPPLVANPDIVRLNLRRKILSSYFQEAYERNGRADLNNDEIRDIIVDFFNNQEVFPGGRISPRDFCQIVGFSNTSVSSIAPLSRAFNPPNINNSINLLLARDNRPSSSSFIARLIRESIDQYNAWGGIDSREQREINQARPLIEQLRQRLSNELMFYNHGDLVDLMISDAAINAPFDTPEIQNLINQIRNLLGPAVRGVVDTDQRTRRLARMFNIRISYNAGNVYEQAPTRQSIVDHLNTWQEAPSAEIQNGLRNRITELLENNNDDFTANPAALNRVISSYISEIRENGLYGADEAERIRNAYRFFYLELTAPRIAPAGLPIQENDLRTVTLAFLNQGATSIIDSHNTRINRINTVVRDRTYQAIRNQANGLHVPFTNDEVDNASERALQRLLTTNAFTLDEIAQVLYLPLNRRDRTDIVSDMSSKIRALRTSVRFAENPRKRLSDTEINTMLIPFMPNCEKIVEELMRIAPIPGALNSYDYRLQLEMVLNDPTTNPVLYLKFKEIAGKYGNITDISMLQDISMHRALQTHGYTLNLTQVMNAGFSPNPMLRSYIQNNNVRFNDCISGYNNTFEYLRERHSVLNSIPEANRSNEQRSELELLTEINTNIQSFNDLLKDIAENYRNIPARAADDRARRLYNILQRKYNTTNGTATPLFAGLFPGASDMEENLAKSYKALTALNTVFVPRVEESSLVPEIDPATGRPKLGPNGLPIMINPADAERRPMENARQAYARNRRNLQKWMWFSRPKQDRLDDSRRDYLQASKDYTLNQIQNEFPESDFTGTPEKINQRKIDRRNRILELINSERRDLFNEELNAQTGREGFIRRNYNRFRNAWRKRKGFRLIGGAVCLGGALGGAAIGLPAAALGTFVLTGAAIRGVSTYMGWTAGWEALRNRFGKTKKLDRAKISAMTPDQLREAMAAQTTLALSEKGQPHTVAAAGGIPSHTPATRPIGVLTRPVTDQNFDRAEASGVNAMFSSEYQEQRSPTPDSNYYRQDTARELWANQNQKTRELIDNTLNNGGSLVDALTAVYAEEEKLMKEIEKREVLIRKSNTKKHATGLALGAFMAVGIPALFALKDWLFPADTPPVDATPAPVPNPVPIPPQPLPPPIPSPVPLPVPLPTPSSAELVIPDRVFGPYVGNADKLLTPGLTIDETPGIWQSIANKLDMTYGSSVIDSNPAIKASLLADNPQLAGRLGGVRTGDIINVSPKTAEMLADSINSTGRYPGTMTASSVLTDLHKPWPTANM